MVNLKLKDLIESTDRENFIMVCKILKTKYLFPYSSIAKASGIGASQLRTMIHFDTYEGVINDQKIKEGIEKLKVFFIY